MYGNYIGLHYFQNSMGEGWRLIHGFPSAPYRLSVSPWILDFNGKAVQTLTAVNIMQTIHIVVP